MDVSWARCGYARVAREVLLSGILGPMIDWYLRSRAVGREVFDDPRLDTLLLTMPIAWKGTVVQYAGRLHRSHPGKREACIYDYVDVEVTLQPAGMRANGRPVEVEESAAGPSQFRMVIWDSSSHGVLDSGRR